MPSVQSVPEVPTGLSIHKTHRSGPVNRVRVGMWGGVGVQTGVFTCAWVCSGLGERSWPALAGDSGQGLPEETALRSPAPGPQEALLSHDVNAVTVSHRKWF